MVKQGGHGSVEKHLAFIGMNVDKLASLEMRGQRLDQGVIDKLHRAARQKLGAPLTMLAAEKLAAQVSASDTVIITTGAGRAPYLPKGETDGPLGAAAVARALRYGLDAIPVILCEEDFVENIAATCVAAGVAVRDYETAKVVPFSCTVQSFPCDDTVTQAAQNVMKQMKPKALIAIEKLGPNVVGIAHSAVGMQVTENRARVEHLFDLARESGVLTIGIGDNGNEIGFGIIADAVRKYKEYGDVCQCPCGKGLACATETDVLIVAGTSNWGAYGIEACLAAILGKPELIHEAETERRMLEECVRTGAVDASYAQQVPSVDGTPAYVQTALLDLMRFVVIKGLGPGRKKTW
jgi:hypothetical protein